MIDHQSVLAVIPARGGSKSVPEKNIREVAGKPLIAWTIEVAKQSRYLDRAIVSTEDLEIAQVAKQCGCEVPFRRPRELAQDDTPGIDPVLHALEMVSGYAYVVLLQPTSPLRLCEDIDQCIELCGRNGNNACVSISEPDRNPYWMYSLDAHGKMHPLLELDKGKKYARRQDVPLSYALNGAVYVADVNWLKKHRTFVTTETVGYIMPRERSIDIDSEFDLAVCNWLLEKKHHRSFLHAKK